MGEYVVAQPVRREGARLELDGARLQRICGPFHSFIRRGLAADCILWGSFVPVDLWNETALVRELSKTTSSAVPGPQQLLDPDTEPVRDESWLAEAIYRVPSAPLRLRPYASNFPRPSDRCDPDLCNLPGDPACLSRQSYKPPAVQWSCSVPPTWTACRYEREPEPWRKTPGHWRPIRASLVQGVGTLSGMCSI